MENFVLCILVGLVAYSNFACAGKWDEACPVEAQAIRAMMAKTEGWKEHVPTCWMKFWDLVLEHDWSCVKKCRRNWRECGEGFNGGNMMESMQNCMAADWSCLKECHERALELYERIDWQELRECAEQFKEASNGMYDKFGKEMWSACETMQLSETCKSGIEQEMRERWGRIASAYGLCN